MHLFFTAPESVHQQKAMGLLSSPNCFGGGRLFLIIGQLRQLLTGWSRITPGAFQWPNIMLYNLSTIWGDHEHSHLSRTNMQSALQFTSNFNMLQVLYPSCVVNSNRLNHNMLQNITSKSPYIFPFLQQHCCFPEFYQSFSQAFKDFLTSGALATSICRSSDLEGNTSSHPDSFQTAKNMYKHQAKSAALQDACYSSVVFHKKIWVLRCPPLFKFNGWQRHSWAIIQQTKKRHRKIPTNKPIILYYMKHPQKLT